ncbi:2249_t:CDS:2, partial [Acaulospora morrowiae]
HWASDEITQLHYASLTFEKSIRTYEKLENIIKNGPGIIPCISTAINHTMKIFEVVKLSQSILGLVLMYPHIHFP